MPGITTETQRTPLPQPQFFIILCIRLVEPVAFALLFPFVYFMVRDFNITDDQDKIAMYAGFIASSFAVAEFLSGVPWGILSDRIGRKPVIMLGLFGTMISMFLFGLSQSLAWAMVTRFMAGFLSGNVGVLKSMVGEMTDRSNRATGFVYLTMSFGMGYIVGPALGGFLTHPVNNFPWLFGGNRFLTKYPYFLPCGVSSALCAIALIFAYFYLEETRPVVKNISMSACESAPLLNSESSLQDYGSKSESQDLTITASSWYVINSYIGLSLLSVMQEELLPFWAATPIFKGGLSYNSSQIGMIVTFGGIVLVFMQIFAFPLLHGRFGTLTIYRRVFLFYAPTIILFPLATHFSKNGYPTISWYLILVLYGLRSCCGVTAFTGFNILLPESCPNKAILGKVNGIAQALGSLVRGIGPCLCGFLWSWSLSNSLPFPFDYHFTFLFVALIAFCTYFLVARVKQDMVLH